ncbi:hypothetical protein ORJ04_09935 [Rheinheimera baltica]|uniref:Uncharacterized protein n=1 Tax=Rheinheimera baltica TaxID=67576 RepID=A0ABT9HYS6_9GAMM|nr:hypothetical protein [Rheinheimera baltica]MDP5136270.1 hypothetical protein [Rheinheimera baltica]
MSLNVNQSLNASSNVASIFSGNEPRRALPRNEEATELPKGRGIRASAEVTDRLDDERRQQTNFRSATHKRSQQAIEAYQSQANEQRRSEVQSMLGVDLYA